MAALRVRRVIVTAVLAVTSLALLYGARVAWLHMGATEGDVPDTSAIPLPAGAQIVSEEVGCASGGCWILVRVRPADGETPRTLAAEIGVTPRLELPGNVWDPRSIWLSAAPDGEVLSVMADYTSGPHVP